MEDGGDTITGNGGLYGIINYGTIDTSKGNDTIVGNSGLYEAIFNNGIINMGTGNDVITGNGVQYGISNYATINTGTGNDTITGVSNIGTGIRNQGTIDAGDGNDTLVSSASLNGVSLDGSGVIKMGTGNDYIRGFGNMTVFGDTGTSNSGFDKLDLGSLNFADFTINTTVGASGANFAQFTYNGITMTTNEFEQFIFADKVVNYSGLA